MTASWTKAFLLAFAMYVPGVLAAAPPADSAILRSFDAPDGETYLAVSLRSDELPTAAVPHDHVILVDTSASQIGEHRQHGHAVVAAVLDRLPATDRVAVYAVDLESVALTDGFVSPAEARDVAVAALHERFPAGATDLAAAIDSAAKQLGTERPGSILYIGDGMSTARLIQPEEMQSLLATLTSRQIPLHSYAVGPNKDLRLLGVLGQHTGGLVLNDGAASDDTPENVGATLASALDRPVFYPESMNVNWESAELLPNAPLPMRTDRTTVYLARGRVAGEAAIELAGTLNGKPVSLSWEMPEPKYVHGNTFLAHLWWQAEADNGLSNSLAGEEMIAATHQLFEDSVAQLEAQGQQALDQGQTDVAEQIGLQLRNIDPRNVRAASLINSEARPELRMVAQAQPAPAPAPAPGPDVQPPVPGAPPQGAPGPGLEYRELPADASRIELVEQARIVKAEKLRLELEEAIQDAQEILPSDPGLAQARLEGTLATIKSATDIDPDVQGELLRQVTAALQDIRSQTEVIVARQAEAQRRLAEIEAQKRLIDFVDLREEKLEQLVDRVRALMEEGFHGNPNAFEEAEAVARIIESNEPGNAVGVAALFGAEAAGQLDKIFRLRSLRADRLLETMYQVELSHVPFPDEPPIRYPPAEVWQALTEQRRKWSSVDLHQNSPNEQRIYEQLDAITEIEFQGSPLSDVVTYISELHNIPILLDEAALSEVGIGPDEEISLIISGIKLRSALKIMLENVQGVTLTYLIEDEVMKITTAEVAEADDKMQTRVYPVADLVIPIQPLGGGFGGGGIGGGGGAFGGAGGGGGFGGGGGGFGGGGGGFGGGGGGGQGGFGGGFFSIPSEPRPDSSIDAGKKKP
ncbi:hypothetical protein Mal4_26390 [Maioricimonas rarisocia]|uniref:VWFA domain-containing protein n=2 Tax=Maioricimonas rarisocia TaxID=2528026 RepID=A0A517Z743_9PLAN|nr:hypothetical protein Mal4_26390 [Maioricimonas rarisocia]